jgi:HD-GYP domain-containing protein (c-di-GMP phosphodiesterase class II)
LFGRIIAVVDAFDAMVTNRPYRKARSLREAMQELNRCAGTSFDPEIVLAFLSVLEVEDEDD